MNEVGRARLDLFADLSVDIDGTPVTVTADGSEILVSLGAPAEVLDAVLGVPLPVGLTRRGLRRGLAAAADAASAQGLDVVVTGPDGVLVTVGAHATPNRVSRWATGSERIAFGPLAAVRGPLTVVLRRRARLVADAARRRVAAGPVGRRLARR